MNSSKLGLEIVFSDKKIVEKLQILTKIKLKDNIVYLHDFEIGDYEENYIYVNMNDTDIDININDSYTIFKFIENNIDKIVELRNMYVITTSKSIKIVDIQKIFDKVNRKFNRYNVIKYFDDNVCTDKMICTINTLEDIEINYKNYKVFFYKKIKKIDMDDIFYKTLIIDSQDNVQTHNIILGYLENFKKMKMTFFEKRIVFSFV